MPGLDEYPNVKRSHIVPRMYLRAWADGQTIAMHRLGDGKAELRNIKSVGVQKRYYRRTRPTGEKIDDVEWSLGQGEDAAAPLLRDLDQRWPLELPAKAALAQFFGIQHVRGPAFREPLIVWPLERGTARPSANDLDAGLEDMLEVFVPVSPDRLLLMTWIDEADSAEVQHGSGRHAGTANAFLMRNAHAEWYHHPRAKVPVARGPRTPLSYDLGLTNTPAVVAASKRRQEALKIAQRMLGAPLSHLRRSSGRTDFRALAE